MEIPGLEPGPQDFQSCTLPLSYISVVAPMGFEPMSQRPER